MGLAQRVIEAAGIPTASLSNIPRFTAAVGAPRVAGIEHPGCKPLGAPGDAETQRQVLRVALEVFDRARIPGEVIELPFRWSAGRPRCTPRPLPPIARAMIKKPWLLLNFRAGKLPPR